MSHLQLTKVATPAAPAANKALVFVDTADGLLKIRDAAGVVTTLSNDPNVALTNAANVFTANQQISAAVVSELRLLLTGTAKGRLLQSSTGMVAISKNLTFNGTTWQLDDVTTNGAILAIQASGTMEYFVAAAAANPATLVLKWSVDATGTLVAGTIPDVRLSSNVPLKNAANVFTANQRISAATPVLYINDTAGAADARLTQIYANAGELVFQPVNDAISVGQGLAQLTRAGSWKISGDLTEKSRSAPMGHWTAFTPTFTSGNWTLTGNYGAGYTLIGKTCIVNCVMDVTVAGGANPAVLTMNLPGGFSAGAVIGYSVGTIGIDTGYGMVQVPPSSGTISLYRNHAATGTWTNAVYRIDINFAYPIA